MGSGWVGGRGVLCRSGIVGRMDVRAGRLWGIQQYKDFALCTHCV